MIMRGEYEKPAGLIYFSDFITPEEEEKLLDFISKISFEEVIMHGQVARRKVKAYGYYYLFESQDVGPGDPMPEELLWVRDRAAKFAEIPKEQLVHALITHYPKGASIGWHTDSRPFGPKIMGLSLKGHCNMHFQKRDSTGRKVFEQPLAPRSFYIMSGQCRYKWQHHIPNTKEERYSITFRILKN